MNECVSLTEETELRQTHNCNAIETAASASIILRRDVSTLSEQTLVIQRASCMELRYQNGHTPSANGAVHAKPTQVLSHSKERPRSKSLHIGHAACILFLFCLTVRVAGVRSNSMQCLLCSDVPMVPWPCSSQQYTFAHTGCLTHCQWTAQISAFLKREHCCTFSS